LTYFLDKYAASVEFYFCNTIILEYFFG